MKDEWIVILGNVSDGLTFIGPFKTLTIVSDWVELHVLDHEDFTLARLKAP